MRELKESKNGYFKISYPAEHVLLVTITREKKLNSLPPDAHFELSNLFDTFDENPDLWVAILTGSGTRAFCAGADLTAFLETINADDNSKQSNAPNGFGGVSNRTGKKPIIAAVNGIAYGGGMEIVLNCDLIIAANNAKFALPEIKRGVMAIMGALPRAIRTLGFQRASELALVGIPINAKKAENWGLVNKVCDEQEDVVQVAIQWAKEICNGSPDSLIATRASLIRGWNSGQGVYSDTTTGFDLDQKRLYATTNIKEGLKAFNEKRKPKWSNPKL